MNSATAPSPSTWPRRLRNGLVAVLVAIALFALLGFLILPTLAKSKLESVVTQELGRRATLGKLEFNPFTLRARLTDFALADRDPQRSFVRFAMLDLDLSIASIWKRAPVFDGVRLLRPQVDLTRNEDGSYSIQDLVERLAAQPEGPPARFSINNIEVDDGSVALDDRPHRRKIVVSTVGIGIPFLSSFPYDAKIHVTPRLDGAVDGARFGLTGSSTSPFEDAQEATLELNLDALPLARYVEYVSMPRGLKLRNGALTTRLKLVFAAQKGDARTVVLSGTARVDQLALARPDDSPLAGAKTIDVALARLDWLARSIVLDRIVVDSPDIDLHRETDGALEIERLLASASKPAGDQAKTSTPTAPRAGQPGGTAPRSSEWRYALGEARVTNGILHVTDDAVSPAFKATLTNVAMQGRQLASTGGPGSIDVSFDADDGAHFVGQGAADLGNASARGHFALTNLRAGRLQPYYGAEVRAEFRRGTLDFAGDFDVASGSGGSRITLANGSAAIVGLEAFIPGEHDAALRIERADVGGMGIDTAKKTVNIETVEWKQGSIRVLRAKDGTVNFERVTRPAKALETAERRVASKAAAGGAWDVRVHKVSLERIAADVEDRVPEPAVRLRIGDARISAENVGSAPGSKTSLDVAARILPSGRVRVAGTLVADPLNVDVRINATGIDLAPLRPYFEPRTNIVVTSGSLAAKGRMIVAATRSGTPSASYAGDVTIGDFGSLDRPTSQDLVRWKTLTLSGIDATSEPFKAALGAVAVDQFYARVIVNPDATLNLQQLLAPEAAAAQAASPAASTTVSGVTTKELPGRTSSKELPVSIGRIQLSNGEVQYSDFFVKPNYTAHLTDVSGSVSALSATQAGTVELAGRVEGTAPVDVRGTLNPFAEQLQLDLTAKAADIDLPPLTPYSVKYAGYGIQKGKLSLEVHYRIDDRKLAATNKLKLDQLTFGDRVDSPTATHLPVLLAVSLLKDRNGVINLDLPIAGTLDDPQFSVWGVLVQIFVNLITKAVTAPFALLGSLGGGGGEQLAYVEFAPGHAELSAPSQAKLTTLAKALNDRPALKIDATGRAIPSLDRDGLKHAMLDRAVRAQKEKALAASGTSAPARDTLTIDAAEYPKLLAEVYRAADLPDKPRNVLGIAKTIPPAEMEALLLKGYRVDDEALTALANRRAQIVKEWFAGAGAVAPERVFIVASKLSGDGITDKGSPTRVDFAIR